MKIGTIEAQAGAKAFGFFKTGTTHGGFDAHIPLHIIKGAQAGATLVVQAGLSGLEIEPALILPQIVNEIDPAVLKGTLIIIPLMNTSGFEFEQVNSAWDGLPLNALGRGDAKGTVSQQMIHHYFEAVIKQADALLDIRTGAQWSYHCYAGVYNSGEVAKSRDLAMALGLPQVVLGQPENNSLAAAAASEGKTVVSAFIGGGPGLRDYREQDLGRVRTAVMNALHHLGMLSATPTADGTASPTSTLLNLHTVISTSGARGFTFMDTAKRGLSIAKGEQIGIVRHPFTGEVIETITAPREGVLIHAGASWPVPIEGEVLAMLGDPLA